MSDAMRATGEREPTQWMKTLQQGSPIAFSVGGLSIFLDVILQGLDTFSSVTVPGWVNILLGLGGIWVVLIGLVGVYPLVAETSPRLSLGGIMTGAVGWLILSIGLGWAIILDLTAQATVAEGPPIGPQIFISALILALLSLLLYGVATIRTESPSRSLGYLFLVPFSAFLLLIVTFFGTSIYNIEPPTGVPLALFGLASLGLIAVGYTLRTETIP